MVIKLKRNGEYWTADIKDLPGSPVVGIGRTKLDPLSEENMLFPLIVFINIKTEF